MKFRSTACAIARRTRGSPSGATRWFSSIQDSGAKYSQPSTRTSRFGRARSCGTSKGSTSPEVVSCAWPVSIASRRLWLSGTTRQMMVSR
jgi:hypothetical protein